MLKRTFFVLVSSFVAFFSFAPYVLAQDESTGEAVPGEDLVDPIIPEEKIMPPILPPDGGITPGFLGQYHRYTVTFRGNGEAVVSARIAFTNKGEGPLTEMTLRVPKVEPKELYVYQILRDRYCISYTYTTLGQPQTCQRYQEPDYYQDWWQNNRYKKAKAELKLDELKVTLPTPVAPDKTGSFFVYFRAIGYANKDLFGAYRYQFETLKVEDTIQNLYLGITTDSDLVLKGVKGEVDYRQASAPAMERLGVGGADLKSAELDSFVGQIGQGEIVKTASNLSALESYKVDGAYAKSRAKLYGRELATAISIILLLLLVVVLFVRSMLKKSSKAKTDTKILNDSGMANNFLLSLGVSFASSLIAVGYTIVLYMVGQGLNNLIDYQYQAVVMILMAVISFAVYILILVGPSLFLGVKRGLGWGLSTFAMTVVWLVMFGIVTVSVLFMFRQGPYYPQPVPYYRGGGIMESQPVDQSITMPSSAE